ncbi:T-cell surface glycoprotein CD1a isoform X5 [Marmota monax]|uniref:T-cell surface glycoprotein CD1a isoform X5 n=1 Tax=Marmota monax TaxID=9995 RepID=UPI001EB09BEA|nr:T-cell surface glycoprotein CD1a isoform X5 [Marmota monax]
MLFLLLPLLAALFPGGDSEGGFEEPVSFYVIQTSSFHNHTWKHLGSGWLGELQTHRWNSSSGAIIFLYPWSRGNFSNNELMDLEKFFHTYFTNHQGFYISQLMFKVKPEAWLSSGPSPEPGHLLLVCHVSGFYPKPVWVMWMQGEQEQQGTQRGDFLPNADGTWYLQATLDVAVGEAAGLACRVKHSSLGGQDLVLYWGAPHRPLGLVFLAVIVALALLTGLGFWLRKYWTHREAPSSAFLLK